MNVDIHNITNIKAQQRHHANGLPFFCITLEIETEDKGVNTVRLFSQQPMTLINPAIIQVG